jgi:hypothetical protein
VVSTPIRDVVQPYGARGFVHIAESVDAFIAAAAAAMAEGHSPARLERVDAFLAGMSWDATWARMSTLMIEARARARRHDGAIS